MSLRRILAATDFSDPADAASRLAYSIARHRNARLEIFHACQPSQWIGDLEQAPEYLPEDSWKKLWNQEQQRIEHKLADLRRHLDTSDGVDLGSSYARGEIVAQILTAARANDTEMLVLGARGASGSVRYLFGGVSAKVSRLSPSPVLVTRNVKATSLQLGGFSRIVVAVDYSPVSAELLRMMRELAADEARIRILHVCPVPTFLDADTQASDAVEKLHRIELDRMKAFLVDNQLAPGDYDKFIDIGSPVHQILTRSEEHEADLIVVGSHARTGVERFIGTVADRVLRNASSCVLLVPHDAEPSS